ncbi:oxidoreductase [Hypoxylon rubiginosum]|uniref:Oxidoreductase n=1 Tax=Hypoxylon rubiginosum TaxID=110542 RepID=A0ACB9ZC04_9PEZI|nr:oxidoreductase [Hypoxylon rubiginosum]
MTIQPQKKTSRGLHVFATARTASKTGSLASLPHVTLLSLDMTSAESLAAAAAAVSEQTGGRLDYLVNNPGLQFVGPLLDFDLRRARDMYEVNVLGAVAAVKAFAPLIIAAKGTVVNIASIAGLMYPPYMGLYAATKSALTTASECLRLELRPFNVNVATVITGVVRTRIFANAPQHRLPAHSLDFARDLAARVLRGAEGRVYVGNMSTAVRVLTAWFPTWVVDYLTVANTGLDHLP